MSYSVELISPERKDDLYAQHLNEPFHMAKADIYGSAIKLYTTDRDMKERWEDNFYAMSDSVRSHGRLILLKDGSNECKVLYEPVAKTAFLYNFDYYGWVKSVALAVAGDLLEDEHHIHSVHGAALDINGRGVAMIAPSKTGKTTHAWGLLRLPGARLITDDWFYVRMTGRPDAYGSEKNCYVDADIGTIWPEYSNLLSNAVVDNKGRAIVNVRWVTGQGSVVPMTGLQDVIFLKRDKDDDVIVRPLDAEEGLEYLIERDFCNPHQMVRDERKMRIRSQFFLQLLQQTRVHLVNTISSPEETQNVIRRLLL
ncbi:MAG: hypothetical protein A4E32_01805 [Methanomassiliicoccales archaeon PtaU1.Bin124]|nr:MAG: hypothetical protein A4E32_01805 [Methanomassiliicoccales archaeon PtaU1.Bin124]